MLRPMPKKEPRLDVTTRGARTRTSVAAPAPAAAGASQPRAGAGAGAGDVQDVPEGEEAAAEIAHFYRAEPGAVARPKLAVARRVRGREIQRRAQRGELVGEGAGRTAQHVLDQPRARRRPVGAVQLTAGSGGALGRTVPVASGPHARG